MCLSVWKFTRDLLLGQPAQTTLRLLLEPDAEYIIDGFPLLVGQPEHVTQQRQRAADGGGEPPLPGGLASPTFRAASRLALYSPIRLAVISASGVRLPQTAVRLQNRESAHRTGAALPPARENHVSARFAQPRRRAPPPTARRSRGGSEQCSRRPPRTRTRSGFLLDVLRGVRWKRHHDPPTAEMVQKARAQHRPRRRLPPAVARRRDPAGRRGRLPERAPRLPRAGRRR